MREIKAVQDPRDLGHAEAEVTAARLRAMLPAELAPLIDFSFVRSHLLYEEFVCRLVLRVIQDVGLEAPLRTGGSAREMALKAGLEIERTFVALTWMLRHLAARKVLDEIPGEDPPRFHARGPLPVEDPVPVREEQSRHDASWMPSYVLAETVAQAYPAFLRGEVSGEEVLFSPRRLRLWIDYFSNANRLYAVNNRIGALAVEQWLPHDGGVLLELGGGLGSGALAVLERLEMAGRLDAIREYRFTEFVPAFLRRGQQALRARYPERSSLLFDALDMNRPFGDQGIAPESVRVVYAVNTLHVAHDLDFTLGEVRRALEPGGRLIVSECVRPYPRQTIYAEFIFNLLETFRSPRLHPLYRPSGGFLTPEQWLDAIGSAGFVDTQMSPDIMRIRRAVPDVYSAALGATRPR
jgi:SAM-dependent methyltransferase